MVNLAFDLALVDSRAFLGGLVVGLALGRFLLHEVALPLELDFVESHLFNESVELGLQLKLILRWVDEAKVFKTIDVVQFRIGGAFDLVLALVHQDGIFPRGNLLWLLVIVLGAKERLALVITQIVV